MKVIADKILEPTFVEDDFLFKIGDIVWAARRGSQNSYFLGEISAIRFDESTNTSRYQVSNRVSNRWADEVVLASSSEGEQIERMETIRQMYGYEDY